MDASALAKIGGALISAGGSVGGGLISGALNYKYSKKLAEQQHNYNKELGEMNQKYALESMAKQNEYNVANAKQAQEYAREANEWNRQNTKDYYNLVMQGALEAGVNPLVAFGGAGGTAGTNAASIAGSSGGSGSAGGAGLASADANIVGQGIITGSQNLADAYSKYLDNEMKEAKIKQTEANTGLTGAQTGKTLTENKLVEAQIKKTYKEAEQLQSATKNLNADTRNKLTDIVIKNGGAWAQKLGTDLYLSIMGKHKDATKAFRIVDEILGSNTAKALGGILGFTKMFKAFKGNGIKEITKIFSKDGEVVGGKIMERFFN